MEEQPSDKIETIIYMGLNLDLYKFRNYYLIIVKQKINNKLIVMGATIANQTILDNLKRDIEETIANGEAIDNYDNPFPVSEFFSGMAEGNWGGEPSHIRYFTYRSFLERRRDNTTSENNRAIFNRMLLADEFANRYMLTVVAGPLTNCVFDADGFDINNNKPFFLGDKPMTVLGNIMDKVYLKYVTIKKDLSGMTIPQRDSRRMAIATALQKAQTPGAPTLPTSLMYEIKNFGGKKKRKSLKKKRKSKRKKSLKKKQRKTKRKGRR